MRRLFFWFSSSFNFPRSSFFIFSDFGNKLFFSLHLLPIFASPAQKNRNNGRSIFWKDFCGKHNFSPVTEVFFFLFIYLVHFIPPCCRFQWKSASASWSVSHRKEMLIIWSLTDLLYVSLMIDGTQKTCFFLFLEKPSSIFFPILHSNATAGLYCNWTNKFNDGRYYYSIHPSSIFFRFVQLVCHFLFTSFSFSFSSAVTFTTPIGFFLENPLD
jgi:hypothetical protein